MCGLDVWTIVWHEELPNVHAEEAGGYGGYEPLLGGQGAKPPWSWQVLAKQRQNMYINFPHLLHICNGWWATLPTKDKCDPFVRGSGSAKSYSLGWQFLTFPIGVVSSKRHINTRLLTLLESCVAAIWQPGFLRIAPHINLRKLAPSWLVILTNELHSTKQ